MANENNAPATIDLKGKAMEAAEKKEAVTPDLIRNVSVNIGGRDIPLRYTMRVQLEIEEQLGMDFSEINDKQIGRAHV